MGIEQSGGTDTRPEGADKPQAHERPPGPPPDRPGQPGYPSRMESRRESREAALAAKSEKDQQETGTDQRDERQSEQAETSTTQAAGEERGVQAESEDTRPAPEQDEDESAAEDQRDHATTETAQPDTEAFAADTDASDRVDRKDEQAEAAPAESPGDEPNPPADDRLEGSETDQRARDVNQTDESAADPRAEDGGEASTEPLDERDQTGSSDQRAPGTDTSGARTGQEATTETQDAADVQQTPEGQPRSPQTPERPDAYRPPMAWSPATAEGVTRWASAVVQFNERTPGTQLENRDRNAEGRPETPATTHDETNKYRHLPDRTPAGISDRGDPISPEDDPADRNPDPEDGRRSRWENLDRANTAFGATKKVLKGVDDLQAKPPPTGRAEVRTNTTIHAPDAQVGNPADAIGNAIIVTLTVTGWALQTYRKFGNSRRRDHADN